MNLKVFLKDLWKLGRLTVSFITEWSEPRWWWWSSQSRESQPPYNPSSPLVWTSQRAALGDQSTTSSSWQLHDMKYKCGSFDRFCWCWYCWPQEQQVRLLTCVREVPGSNWRRHTAYPALQTVFLGFPQAMPLNYALATYPYTFFQSSAHYLSVHSELRRASSNRPQTDVFFRGVVFAHHALLCLW